MPVYHVNVKHVAVCHINFHFHLKTDATVKAGSHGIATVKAGSVAKSSDEMIKTEICL